MGKQTNSRGSLASWYIYMVILLGTLGLLGTISYFKYDLKPTFYHQEVWKINHNGSLIDTLNVVIHPQVSIHSKPAKIISGIDKFDYSELFFPNNPVFLVWVALMALMVAYSISILPIIIRSLITISREAGLKNRDHFEVLLITLFVSVCLLLTGNNTYLVTSLSLMKRGEVLLSNPCRVNIIIVFSSMSGLVAVVGQLMINKSISKLPDHCDKNNARRTIDIFNMLRKELKFFLLADAVLVVFSVITTDTLRRAIFKEIVVKDHDLFPQEFVFLYGMIFTFYLALLYLPVFYRLKNKGDTIIANSDETVFSKEDRSEFLLKESPVESFKVAFSILAPIVSSLLPGLLKF